MRLSLSLGLEPIKQFGIQMGRLREGIIIGIIIVVVGDLIVSSL